MKVKRSTDDLLMEDRTYEVGRWRGEEINNPNQLYLPVQSGASDSLNPDARERSRLLRLLGLINYRILTGNRIYVEVGGIVYKTLCGLYWRSVFTGVEHYLLRCEEVSGGIWAEGSKAVDLIDLPIKHTQDGWTAKGHSLVFMLTRDC